MPQTTAKQAHRALIQIVDDTPENINVLGSTLKKAGYGVIACTNGPQAVQVATSRHPDLVLLDIQMPEMDGFEVCRRLKANPSTVDIPIIFITAKADLADIVHGFDAGAVDYVTKPFNSAELLARARTHLELKFAREIALAHERELAALACQLAAANRALSALSLLDALTGIANRRQFDQNMAEEWWRAKRDNLPLGLVLCDIDHFKHYNDTYGHLQGDECLRQVAGALTRAIHRPGDTAARYGGEEFVLILPGTDKEGAGKIARLAIRQVMELAIPHPTSDNGQVITISAGVSAFVPQAGSALEDLIHQADQALYLAKNRGRNQVVLFGEGEGPT